MRTVVVRNGARIPLGKQGENNAVRVVWPRIAEKYAELYGDGRFELVAVQKGQAYPAVVSVDGADLIWNVLAADVAIAEVGSLELIYYVGDTIAKSQTWETFVEVSKSAEGTTEPPEPAKNWVDGVIKSSSDAKQSATESAESARQSAESATNAAASATKAENAVGHSPIIGENGNWFIWDFEKSEYVDSGKSASTPPITPDTAGKYLTNDGSKAEWGVPTGGTDTSLDITGATVGQIAKITAVDDTGKPTEWEAADLPNNEKFIVRFSGEGIPYVCDKTMDEIVNAYENGQDISAYFTGTFESGNQYTDLILCLTTYSPYEYIEFKSDIQMYKLHRVVAYIDGSGGCGVFEETALDDSLTNDSMAANAKAVGDALSRKQDILIQSGAAIGQIAKITAVDETGKPTAWEAVDIPSGGSDISLGLTAAIVSQIVKVKAVDADGKPTAWELVTPETWNFVMADGTTVTKKVYVDANE